MQLKTGQDYTIILISEALAHTVKWEVTCTSSVDRTWRQRGKRKQFRLEARKLSQSLIFEGWDIPIRIDSEVPTEIGTTPGISCVRSFSGNACFNLVGEPEMLRDWIDSRNINTEFAEHGRILYGVDAPGEELLYPDRYNGGHAAIERILKKKEYPKPERHEVAAVTTVVSEPIPTSDLDQMSDAELEAELAKLQAQVAEPPKGKVSFTPPPQTGLEVISAPGDIVEVRINHDHKGIELKFPRPVNEALSARLAAYPKFRYHGLHKKWYRKNCPESLVKAQKIAADVNANPNGYLLPERGARHGIQSVDTPKPPGLPVSRPPGNTDFESNFSII